MPKQSKTDRNEAKIIKAAIKNLLGAGFLLSVDNGGDDFELDKSSDADEIFKSMKATCDERLYCYKSADAKGHSGWIRFIYNNGEDGCHVIADYTTNLDPQIEPVMELAGSLESTR